MKLVRRSYGTRKQVAEDSKNIYIFTDNCDRSSGKGEIPDDSTYSKRFGKKKLKYPAVTSAFIRGLENSFPITTQKKYVPRPNQFEGNWTDDDFEEFKKVIDDDFEAIKEACKRLKPQEVRFPSGGILNGSISRITFLRTPLLYNYIIQKEIELRDFNI